jgi:hypothetical protein
VGRAAYQVFFDFIERRGLAGKTSEAWQKEGAQAMRAMAWTAVYLIPLNG